VALDAAPETLKIAAGRISSRKVRFVVGDAYYLPDSLGQFDAAFLGFWFSHIPMRRRREFLQNLANRLHDGARVLILDNHYVEGSNRPITEEDDDGNTYQSRRLDDGSTHRVLKNFPTESELVTLCAGLGKSMVYTVFEYYWVFQYEVVK
jgi:ubiquinone/menaquinone biosynthesis C-methylase UbiE